MTDKTDTEHTPEAQGPAPMDVFNTAAGWVLISAVVGLGLSILSSMYFHGDDPQRPEQLGYVIEGVIEEGAADAGPSFEEALTLVTAADGERVFAKCGSCHSIEQGGANGVGPNLYGIMGANIAGVSGFSYSAALSGRGGQWGWDEMNQWLLNPRGYVDGTSMGFAGLNDIEDRAAVILYLNTFGSNLPVPEFTPAEAPAEDAAPEEGSEEGAAEGDGEAEAAPEGDTAAADAA